MKIVTCHAGREILSGLTSIAILLLGITLTVLRRGLESLKRPSEIDSALLVHDSNIVATFDLQCHESYKIGAPCHRHSVFTLVSQHGLLPSDGLEHNSNGDFGYDMSFSVSLLSSFSTSVGPFKLNAKSTSHDVDVRKYEPGS